MRADLRVADRDARDVVVASLNGAFSVTPALAAKSTILRSPGAPITRANTPTERGLSADGRHTIWSATA